MNLKHEPLAATTEARLWPLAAQGNTTAANQIVKTGLWHVNELAGKRAHGNGAVYEDLIDEGHAALALAWSTFNICGIASNFERPGCRFHTFARQRIDAAMIERQRTRGGLTSWEARQEGMGRALLDAATQEGGRDLGEEEFRLWLLAHPDHHHVEKARRPLKPATIATIVSLVFHRQPMAWVDLDPDHLRADEENTLDRLVREEEPPEAL